jgi:hypothetical protein
MSFSASTCLNYVGSYTLSPTLSVYSNPVSPSNLGVFVTTVPSSEITGGNCPYILVLPDGTTTIRLYDIDNFCYTDIPVSNNDLCVTCDLNFNSYVTPSVGKIVAGDITGSCDASISNYLINWYNVSDPLNPIFKFSSGKGTMFAPYLYTHPLVGTSSPLSTSGTFEPRLEKIELNGVLFSKTEIPGYILAEMDCLPSIEVTALNCDNGGDSSDLPQYEHKFFYSATTGGITPEPLTTTFELSAGTKYFPWKFKGFSVPDKLKLTFSGSAYPQPLILEYWEVGSDLTSNNFNSTTFPKSASTAEYFGKVTTLSGLTVNAGDAILIEVTPSTSTTQTSWTFYCGCLDTVNCDICIPDEVPTDSGNTSYTWKIVESTISVLDTSCVSIIAMSLSGCNMSEITGTTIYQYAGSFYNNAGYARIDRTNNYINYNGPTPDWGTNSIYFNQLTCQYPTWTQSRSCNNLGEGIDITYNKTPTLFKVTSNSLTPITMIYDNYKNFVVPSISPFSGDNTNIGYYRYFTLEYTTATGITPCGDGIPNNSINFHQSSIVTTGTTGSNYFIQFTIPMISAGITYDDCDLNCIGYQNQLVDFYVNTYSSSTFNYTGTTNVGAIRNNGIYFFRSMSSSVSTQTGATLSGGFYTSFYQNYTIPASGTSYTLIPSLSGVTCPNLGLITNNGDSLTSQNIQRNYNYYYVWEFFDETAVADNFRIYAHRINESGNLVFPREITLVYEYLNGTLNYSNSNYLI